jgi:hypothetical protein
LAGGIHILPVLILPDDPAIENSRLLHLDRPNASDQRASRMVTVADHLLATTIIRESGMPLDPVCDFCINRLSQKTLRPASQDLGQRIAIRNRDRGSIFAGRH